MHLSEEEKEFREWLKQRGALSGEAKVGGCLREADFSHSSELNKVG